MKLNLTWTTQRQREPILLSLKHFIGCQPTAQIIPLSFSTAATTPLLLKPSNTIQHWFVVLTSELPKNWKQKRNLCPTCHAAALGRLATAACRSPPSSPSLACSRGPAWSLSSSAADGLSFLGCTFTQEEQTQFCLTLREITAAAHFFKPWTMWCALARPCVRMFSFSSDRSLTKAGTNPSKHVNIWGEKSEQQGRLAWFRDLKIHHSIRETVLPLKPTFPGSCVPLLYKVPLRRFSVEKCRQFFFMSS